MLFFSSYQIIEPSYKGLVIKGGQLQEDNLLSNGFYFKTPFWTDITPVYIGVNTTDSGLEDSPFSGIRPLSKDGQIMDVDVQINYSITDPIKFRKNLGSIDPRSIEGILFIPMVRRLVYDYVSEYSWKNLIQGGDRQELGQRIFRSLSSGEINRRVCEEEKKFVDKNTGAESILEAGCKLLDMETISNPEDYGVIVTAVNLRKVAPNNNIIAAVEEAQKKEQEVKIAEQEAEIEKQNAIKLIEKKRGETESLKLQQEAEAYKIKVGMEANAAGIKAEAEAKLLQAKAEKELAEALRDSSGLIDYKRLDIEKIYAEAQLEFAKHYSGQVPENVTIVGTEEAKNMRMFMGVPQVSVLAGEDK